MKPADAPSIAVVRQRFISSQDRDEYSDTELSLTNCTDCQSPPEADVPAKLAALFAQRQSARDAVFPSSPEPGLILRIPQSSSAAAPGASSEPLAILLDKEISAGRWRGWLVGRDLNFACDWDLILGPEDDPRDPMCQVVQVWNRVSLAVAHADQVLASLPADRLAAVRSLDREFSLPKPVGIAGDHRMGVLLARELVDGTGVVTGTPVVSADDPRQEYQGLYREAALQVSQRSAVAPEFADHRDHVIRPSFLIRLANRLGLAGRGWAIPVALAATLLILPAVVFLVRHQSNENPPDTAERYISGGSFQQILSDRPDMKSRELDASLRAAGARPEIRTEAGGTVILEANLAPLKEDARRQILAAYRLSVPPDQQLRVLITSPTPAPQAR